MASATPPANAPQQNKQSIGYHIIYERIRYIVVDAARQTAEEVDINLNDPQVGEAAKKIQNVFRNRKQDKKSAPAHGSESTVDAKG
ncbi:hypothetical protein RB195_018162 [Necator americanus]|uniref:Uncharacterized protein n=1 Tax=Necator americanus TaxID=51031 RepID=A0ABR1C8G8_NECAM